MDLMDLAEGRAKILAFGPWTEDMVKIDVRSSCAPYRSWEMRKIAKERYDLRQEKREQLGLRQLDDNDVMHLCAEHSCIAKREAFLVMGRIKYSEFCIATLEVAEELGCTLRDLPVGIGVNAVIVTADHSIVLMESSRYVDFPGKIDLVAGCYNSGTPFEMMRQEIYEEIGLHEEELLDMRMLGLSIRLNDRVAHALHFFVDTPLDSKEIRERAKHAPDSWEGEVFFLPCLAETVRGNLVDYSAHDSRMVSSCYSALVLAGRHMWGEKWSQIS